MLSERQRRILIALSHADSPITGQQLAELLGVSLRTVQGEMARINRMGPLIESNNKGYTVNRGAFAELEAEEPWGSCAPVTHNILQALIFGGRQRVSDLAEMLYVSSATFDRHVRELVSILEPYGLEIERSSGWVWIEGDELRKRQLIGDLVAQETDGALATTDTSEAIFGSMDCEVVRSIVTSTIESFGCRIRPGFEGNLLGSITIALYRIHSDALLLQRSNEPDFVEGGERVEYQIAKELCRRYSNHLDITPNYSEQTYLAHLLRGQIERVADGCDDSGFHVVQSKFIKDIEGIVDEVLELFSLRVGSAQSLYNFAMHVDALMYRTEENQIRSVEVLENVKRYMPFVYEMALLVSSRISRHFNIVISEGEVGFICIHMGMILHSTMDQDRVTIGLACQDYYGISETIRSGICAHFPNTVQVYDFDAPISEKQLERFPVDLIVTTQHLRDRSNIVEISPFLSPSDLMRIEQAVNSVLGRKNVERTRHLMGLHLDERLFFKTDAFETKNEAIRFLGEKLQEYGVVDDSFTQSVLEREAISSTCFFDLFAIPHALEMNSARTLMAILLSKRGIVWDSSVIHVVLMIAVSKDDRQEFVELYNRIVKSLCNGAQIAKVIQSDDVEEFMDSLSLMTA